MAMPQQTEIIKKLRQEVAELQARITGLDAMVRTLTSENENLTKSNERLQDTMESQRVGFQADLDGAQRLILSLRTENAQLTSQRYDEQNSLTEAVAEIDSKHFEERSDLLKGLETVLIALGRSA